jgi:hypothetical protein
MKAWVFSLGAWIGSTYPEALLPILTIPWTVSSVKASVSFPFLSQELFSDASNGTNFVPWNQTAVIGADNRIDPVALAQEGLPYFATTYGLNVLVINMSATAAITHLLLWYRGDMKAVFTPYKLSNLRKLPNPESWHFWKDSSVPNENQDNYDPRYRLIMSYKAVPNWWFGIVLALSFTIGMIILYQGHTTLPWWGFIIAMLIGYVFLIIFGAMIAISGVQWLVQPIVQMIGGYIQVSHRSPLYSMFRERGEQGLISPKIFLGNC